MSESSDNKPGPWGSAQANAPAAKPKASLMEPLRNFSQSPTGKALDRVATIAVLTLCADYMAKGYDAWNTERVFPAERREAIARAMLQPDVEIRLLNAAGNRIALAEGVSSDARDLQLQFTTGAEATPICSLTLSAEVLRDVVHGIEMGGRLQPETIEAMRTQRPSMEQWSRICRLTPQEVAAAVPEWVQRPIPGYVLNRMTVQNHGVAAPAAPDRAPE